MTVVYLSEYDPAERPAVLLFSGMYCHGRVGRFYGPDNFSTSTDKVDYKAADLNKFHVGDNAMRSLMVPYGVTVDLYDKADLTGEPLTIVGQPWLNEN